MTAILNFFDWISTFFTSIFDFVVGIIENIVLMLEYIGIASSSAFDIIASLPSWLQAFGIITITISIIFVIVGRTGGKSKGE